MNGIEKPGAVSLWDHRSPMGFTLNPWNNVLAQEHPVADFVGPQDPYDPSNTNLRPL